MGLLSTILAPSCATCEARCPDQAAFCALCDATAYRLRQPACSRCQQPMASAPGAHSSPTECSACRRRPPRFERAYALFEYSHSVADAIRRIKYGRDLTALRALCRALGPWLMERLRSAPRPPHIIPIPPHPRSLRRRGFHLPTLLLRWSLARPHRSLITHGLRKTRLTKKQASLPLAQRPANIRDAFHPTKALPEAGPIVLFDDVLTSGATLNSAADALRSHGHRAIEAWTLARAP